MVDLANPALNPGANNRCAYGAGDEAGKGCSEISYGVFTVPVGLSS
jgi:hypothetical protein